MNAKPKAAQSLSGSPRQPQAAGPLIRFEDYTDKGRPALAIQIDIRDMAKMYREHPRMVGAYPSRWASGSSSYIPRWITNADDALDAIADFVFPAELKAQARRAARRLVGVFSEVARLKPRRDLVAGRLDRRKLVKIARHTAAGSYDPNQIRPYRRTVPTPAQAPTVMIVAGAGNAEMWNDETLLPRIITLTLAVQWACEAAGLHTYAAFTQEFRDWHDPDYAEAIYPTYLARPDAVISPRAYAVTMHRTLWMHGSMTVQAADYEGTGRLAALRGIAHSPSKVRGGKYFRSVNGGRAVSWARSTTGADLVIATGSITDKRDADIVLDSTFTLDRAVTAIIAQAKQLEAQS